VSPVPDAAVDAIVLDIEGTTTPVAFVYQTLFPYARRHLRTYLEERADDASTAQIVEGLRREQSTDPDASNLTTVDYVEWLMDRDRKSTALKALQGRIWDEGYRRGELIGEVFPDVLPSFEAWRRRRIRIGIFSSGSVLAQKLLFAHSSAGDLTRFLSWYFDTTTGPKTASDSYGLIASAVGVRAGRVLFVSDVVGELDAARDAGMHTALSLRPGNAPVDDDRGHPAVHGFLELSAVSA
jgi:enolase-phosphatase E1